MLLTSVTKCVDKQTLPSCVQVTWFGVVDGPSDYWSLKHGLTSSSSSSMAMIRKGRHYDLGNMTLN